MEHNPDLWQQLFLMPGDQIPWWAEVFRSVLRLVVGIVFGLIPVPLLVWGERRLLGLLQGRLGPNRVGPLGLFQPLADAMKLMLKEDITPTNVDRVLYFIAPIVALVPVVMSVTVLPWNGSRDWGAVAPRLDTGGILMLLAVASIEVYGVILAGWSSNNKYSLLGGLRASSQVISYELGMGLAIIAVLLMSGAVGTHQIVEHQGVFVDVPVEGTKYIFHEQTIGSGFWNWHVLQFFPFGLIACGVYMISMIAETNRAPFDLPEAETELVAGFHTEYSAFKFAMFFMGEYANLWIVSAICVTLFFGGYLAPWGLLGQLPAGAAMGIGAPLVNFINHILIAPFWLISKLAIFSALFILVRASQPRLRYDMLMSFGWKGLLPTALLNVVMIALAMATNLFVAWVASAILATLLFGFTFAQYRARRRGAPAMSTALVPVSDGETVRLPIRRPSTATPTAANAPADR